MKKLKKCKYGMFVHHILPEAHYADGTQPQTIDEMADAFDTEGFADSLQRMGICWDLTVVLCSMQRRHPQNEDVRSTEGTRWDQYSVETGSYNRRSEA